MKKTAFFAFALILSLCSCKKDKSVGYNSKLGNKSTTHSRLNSSEKADFTADFSNADIENNVPLSQLLNVVKVVPLGNDYPIGNVNKVLLTGDKIAVFDRDVTNSLSLFDSNGGFLCTMGKKGEGPGEYRRLLDVQFNKYSNTIEGWDGLGQKLLKFDQGCRLVSEKSLDVFASWFAPVDSNTYVFFKGNDISDSDLNYRFITLDVGHNEILSKDFLIKGRQFDLNYYPLSVLNYNHFSDSYFYIDSHEYTIYEFNAKKIRPRFSLNFGSKSINPQDLDFNKLDTEAYMKILANNNVYSRVVRPVETKDHLVFDIGSGNKNLTCIYSKADKKGRIYDQIKDDLFGGAFLFLTLDADPDGNYVFLLDPVLVLESIKKKYEKTNLSPSQIEKDLEKSAPLALDIYKNASKTSNPILVFASLKI